MLLMRRARFYITLISSFALLAPLGGCEGGGGSDGGVPGSVEEVPTVVPAGKEDNFFAPKAQEYLLEGQTTITLDPGDEALSEEDQLAKVKRLVPFKQILVGWFLNSYIVGKSKDDTNKDYGSFEALTKNGSYEELGIEKVEGLTWRFTFRQEVGGPLDLIGQIPTERDAEGKAYFDLKIGKVSNADMQKLDTNHEWYRKSPWSTFDPSKVDAARLDTLRLTIEAQPPSLDGWFDVKRLFSRGTVKVGVHFGWDYHNAYHLKHSRALYDWLVENGYRSPVQSYDDYDRSSGPLVRAVKANGSDARVEVYIYWGHPGTDTDPDTSAGGKLLEQDMRDNLRDFDVIIYSGHSGPFYGFALANWRKTDEGDLDDSEIPSLDMPADRYQVVLAEGCETYALGQAFWSNPNKADRKNLDIVTTMSFSNAGTPDAVLDFLRALVGTDRDGRLLPITFGDLLRDLDNNSWWFTTMYGVHGVDDNPHLHPYADASAFCSECARASDCGAEGNFCVALGAGQGAKVCTAACTGDDGCPKGYACRSVASGVSITGQACVPEGLDCAQVAAAEGPKVLINEVLADPPPGEAGDANGDGRRDPFEDEFVEIFNRSQTVAADLSGWTLEDGQKIRFSFPSGTKLPPGGAAVVFGGGDAAQIPAVGTSLLFTAPSSLRLGNRGDSVVLRKADGSIVDRMTYGLEGGKNRSLVRAVEGDPEAAFVPHPGDLPYSAGSKSDGGRF